MENINEKLFHTFLKEMLHPVRAKLFVALHEKKETTAGDLLQALGDVPQATLYRHLNGMVESGVFKIVAERKKRALYEKVYAVSIDFDSDLNELLRNNRGDVYAAMFFQYMMVFQKEFQAYAKRPNIDIANDGSGFSMCPVYVTKEELWDVMRKIGALLEELRANAPGSGREMHTIGLIITPPKDVET